MEKSAYLMPNFSPAAMVTRGERMHVEGAPRVCVKPAKNANATEYFIMRMLVMM
jgi:hypothetical protein